MRSSSFLLYGFVLGISCRVQSQSPISTPAPTLSPRAAYEKLVRSFETLTFPNNLAPQPQGTKVVFLVPDKQESEAIRRPLRSRGVYFSGRIVYSTGAMRTFAEGSMGVEGGSPTPLTSPTLQHLDQLLTRLPKDGGRLPPQGRQLIVLVGEGEHYRVRVYDRAQLPERVLDVVRVVGGKKLSVVQTIGETAQWPINRDWNHDEGAFGASPNGQLVVTRTLNGNLKVWNPQNHALVQELPDPAPGFGANFGFSPDGSLAVLAAGQEATVVSTRAWQRLYHFSEPGLNGKWGQFASPRFTSDGRHLLFQSLTHNESADNPFDFPPQMMHIYDMKTGQSVKTLPEMPIGARTYNPAPQGGRAVYLSSTGALKLWDSKRRRDVALLDPDARINRVSFSPDNSLVAVVTVEKDRNFHQYWKAYRIRIWKTGNGKLLNELSPYETGECDGVKEVLWSLDSRYVLGAVCPNDSYSSWEVAVWSTRTGRHRGTLSTGGQVIEGMALLPNGQLIVGSRDNTIRVFDSKQAFSNIQTFEKSLPPA